MVESLATLTLKRLKVNMKTRITRETSVKVTFQHSKSKLKIKEETQYQNRREMTLKIEVKRELSMMNTIITIGT